MEEKEEKEEESIAVGLISGTSMDGVDVCIVKIREQQGNDHLNFTVLHYVTYDYPVGLKEDLLRLCSPRPSPSIGSIHSLSQFNVLTGRLFGEAVLRALKECNIESRQVKVIGSHGQTVYHQPIPELLHGHLITSTLQIGDPCTIANTTGITTVGDFRLADMAHGGQGAPLVPYLDRLLARRYHGDTGRVGVFLNIGGISNIFAMDLNNTADSGIGFDTGPGNVLIDGLVRVLYRVDYDNGGRYAASGSVNEDLLKFLIREDTFVSKTPPKSTGREYYNDEYVRKILDKSHCLGIQDADVIATVTVFTAHCVYCNYKEYIMCHMRPADHGNTIGVDLLVSGGGAKNEYLMSCLKEKFQDVLISVTSTDTIGVPVDCKEALCFAVLGYQTINHRPTNVPSVTGASGKSILGKICPVLLPTHSD